MSWDGGDGNDDGRANRVGRTCGNVSRFTEMIVLNIENIMFLFVAARSSDANPQESIWCSHDVCGRWANDIL